MDVAGAVSLLRQLVEIESPTYSDGVVEVAEVVARALETLGAKTELLDGGHLRGELEGHGEPLLVIGHTDTVWPLGTLAQMPFRIEGGLVRGPGVYDMKACIVAALMAIAEAGGARRAIRVFFTADEEQGSRTARDALSEATDGVAAALVIEPPTAEGHLKTSRKGLGRFTVTIDGVPAHAGTNLLDGASAVEELAHQILRLHALTDHERGVSVNVGVVTGGTRENVVAAYAQAQLDVRVVHAADLETIEHALHDLEPVLAGTSLDVAGEWTRPPLERTSASRTLVARARAHARDLGFELGEAASGGGSDGNLVGAMGIPVLDGLGVEGGGAHGWDEHILLESLPVRSSLLARLLVDPGL